VARKRGLAFRHLFIGLGFVIHSKHFRYHARRIASFSAMSQDPQPSSAGASAGRQRSIYLGQKEAQETDARLMGEGHFPMEVLMELAGLSIAQAIEHVYPVKSHRRMLVVAGPGNNGGDGLVTARHLKHFSYNVTVLYPKQPAKKIFEDLVAQCKQLEIPILSEFKEEFDAHFDVIVDGIFGFSFTGEVRPPFDKLLERLNQTRLPIASIDIPSGWDVEKGDVSGNGLNPEFLISLTAPKKCARFFKGKYHFVGGRFVPRKLAEEFGLELGQYEGSAQFAAMPLQQEGKL